MEHSTNVMLQSRLYSFLFVIVFLSSSQTLLQFVYAQEATEGKDIMYTDFQGSPDTLAAAFQYPKAWDFQIERGKVETYVQVKIRGPRNEEDTYTSYFTVRESTVKAKGGRFDGAAELLEQRKKTLLAKAQIEEEGDVQVAGIGGRELVVAQAIPPLHTHGLKGIPIPIRTRTVVLKKDDNLYELIYSADQRQYDQFTSDFDHLLKTFAFTGGSSE